MRFKLVLHLVHLEAETWEIRHFFGDNNLSNVFDLLHNIILHTLDLLKFLKNCWKVTLSVRWYPINGRLDDLVLIRHVLIMKQLLLKLFYSLLKIEKHNFNVFYTRFIVFDVHCLVLWGSWLAYNIQSIWIYGFLKWWYYKWRVWKYLNYNLIKSFLFYNYL